MTTKFSSTDTQPIHSYTELREQMHRDLLAQHPEWIEVNGNCPKCEEYDRRLARLISMFESAKQHSLAAA
jgi:hypothetical protein